MSQKNATIKIDSHSVMYYLNCFIFLDVADLNKEFLLMSFESNPLSVKLTDEEKTKLIEFCYNIKFIVNAQRQQLWRESSSGPKGSVEGCKKVSN